MSVFRKIVFLGLGFFFLWLTIAIPNIPTLFTIDISQLSADGRILLQFTTLTLYVASMLAMAFEGDF